MYETVACTGPFFGPVRPCCHSGKIKPGPVCVQPTLNTISLQGVVQEECGGTHETDTHQKISNITRV